MIRTALVAVLMLAGCAEPDRASHAASRAYNDQAMLANLCHWQLSDPERFENPYQRIAVLGIFLANGWTVIGASFDRVVDLCLPYTPDLVARAKRAEAKSDFDCRVVDVIGYTCTRIRPQKAGSKQ